MRRELGAIYMKRVLEPEDARRMAAIVAETGGRQAAEGQARELATAGLAAADDAGLPAEGMALLEELGKWALAGN